jgi:lipoate-protein ligase A
VGYSLVALYMSIALLTDTLATLDENLALDEALLLSAEAGESSEVLRLWEWPSLAVVLGAGGSIAIDVNEEACGMDGVPLHRRASGGGTVLLGRGCLLFSLVLAFDRAAELRLVNSSYRWILSRIANSLQSIGPVEHSGISDLAIRGLKISGNSQQRKTRHVLHHGTVLYDFDLRKIGRYLHAPERSPDYRNGRDHAAFVANLTTTVDAVRQLLAAEFEAEPQAACTAAVARVPGLLEERYHKPDWVHRR